jgi:hypothetical protein
MKLLADLKIRQNSTNRVGEQHSKRQRFSGQIALSWMLTVPFILQVVPVVGCVGYLAHRNG